VPLDGALLNFTSNIGDSFFTVTDDHKNITLQPGTYEIFMSLYTEFYGNGASLGEDTNAPHQYQYSPTMTFNGPNSTGGFRLVFKTNTSSVHKWRNCTVLGDPTKAMDMWSGFSSNQYLLRVQNASDYWLHLDDPGGYPYNPAAGGTPSCNWSWDTNLIPATPPGSGFTQWYTYANYQISLKITQYSALPPGDFPPIAESHVGSFNNRSLEPLIQHEIPPFEEKSTPKTVSDFFDHASPKSLDRLREEYDKLKAAVIAAEKEISIQNSNNNRPVNSAVSTLNAQGSSSRRPSLPTVSPVSSRFEFAQDLDKER